MTWKKLNNNHKGRSDVFGGLDIDKISSLFDGSADVDTVDINSNTSLRDDRLNFRNLSNTFEYSISSSAIIADRNITLPTITNNQTFLMQDMVQTMSKSTLSNCTFDATLAPISRFGGDPIQMRWGTVFPRNAAATPTGAPALEGILSKHTLRSPFANPFVEYYFPGDWVGYHGAAIHLENTATVNEYCGLISPTTGVGMCRMSHDGRIRVRWAQNGNDAGFVCGLSSSTSAPLNRTDPLATNQSGIVISCDAWTNYGTEVIYHNGDGTAPHRTLLALPTEISMAADIFKDMDIKWSHDDDGILHATASIRHTWEGQTTYTGILTTADLPAATTDLFFHCHLINATSTNSEYFDLAGIWIESL